MHMCRVKQYHSSSYNTQGLDKCRIETIIPKTIQN